MLSKVLQTTETERNMIMQNDNDFVVAPSVPVAVGADALKCTANVNTQQRVVNNLADESREALAGVDEKLRKMQLREKAQTFAATVFSSAVSSVMRREYLNEQKNLSLRENLDEELPKGKIKWLRLVEVGVQDDFALEKAAEALECVFSAFHLPGRERLLFLVSSDATDEGEKVTIHLGLQPVGERPGISSNISDVMAGFSLSVWPGLSFTEASEIDFKFKSNPKRPGVRVITGIPAERGDDKVGATIDKLAAALRGRSWRYLVIAEPIASDEMDAAIHTCNELAGKAESLRTFQVSDSFSKAVADSWSHAEGTSNTVSQRQMGTGRAIGVSAVAGVGIAAAGCAALAAVAPVLLPAFAASAPAWLTAGSALASSGILMPLSLAGGALLAGAKTRSEAKSLTDTMSRSVTDTESTSFSRTIVNKHAEATVKLIEEQIKRLQLCSGIGAWEVGAYLIGEDDATADIGANVIKSLISGDDSYQEPVRIFNPGRPVGDANPLVAISRFANPYILPMCGGGRITHPLGERFGNVRTVVNTRELTRFINLPLSNIPGVPVRRIAADTGLRNPELDVGMHSVVLGNQIYRGQILDRYPYSFNKNLLAKHALVCGINGSGKTNTILGILGDLLEKKTPFLVIEPAKQEYVDWALECNARILKEKYKGNEQKAKSDPSWINVYIPGREKWKGSDLCRLMLNPFDFVWLNGKAKPKVLEHIDRLKTIINAALPMQESLPILMEELIFSVYSVPGNDENARKCWLPGAQPPGFPRYDTPTFEEGVSFDVPTFVQMAGKVDRVIERFNYAKEATMNLRAALKARIESFKRGWRLELLNKASPRKSAKDWSELFNRPTVINLTSLTSDEDKAFFMAVILMFVYEYRQELSEMDMEEVVKVAPGIAADGLRSLLVIEEAHRVLGRSEGPVAAFAAAPKQKVSEMFSNMISEVRAYGQGILIADQIPGRLNEDAVKNTNLKIVHKLVSSDDRQSMATGLNLWEDQERIISDLKVGEALVRCDMDDEAYMVKVKKCDSRKLDCHNASKNVFM